MPLSTEQLNKAFDVMVDKGWSALSLSDIALATNLSLADLRGLMSSKYDLVAALNKQVDATVLAEFSKIDEADSARDRLFEVIMARFDALEPFKDALGALALAARSDLKLAALTNRHVQRSMAWMLEAAGLGTGGWQGAFRQKGLSVVYFRASLAWLKDESEDLAATMKALDKALGDAERWANTVEHGSWRDGAERMRQNFSDLAARARSARPGGQRYRQDEDSPVISPADDEGVQGAAL